MDDPDNQTENNSEDIEGLIARLNKAEQNGNAIADQGREITKNGQKISDTARHIKNLAIYAPQFVDVPLQISLWDRINNQSDDYLSKSAEPQGILTYTGGTITTTASTSASSLLPVSSSVTQENFPYIHNVDIVRTTITDFLTYMARPEIKEETIILLRKWGFNNCLPENISALQSFQTSHNAFENPVNDTNPIETSLIPMRECILAVLAGLKHLRPTQSNVVKKDTIKSIVNQLSITTIDDSIITEWESRWEDFKDVFGASKQGAMSRDLWQKHLFETTSFLYALLNSLDISKARKVKPYF